MMEVGDGEEEGEGLVLRKLDEILTRVKVIEEKEKKKKNSAETEEEDTTN